MLTTTPSSARWAARAAAAYLRAPAAGALALTLTAAAASAQGSSADRGDDRCAALLASPTPDSQIVRIGILIRSFDERSTVPTAYLRDLARGLRQFLVLPVPLVLDTYDLTLTWNAHGRNDFASQTLRSAYRVTMRRTGRLDRARAVGGVRSAGFDRALLGALVALDSSGLVPEPDPSWLDRDTLELRVLVTPERVRSTRTPVRPDTATPTIEPLFDIAVPVRSGAKSAEQIPSGRAGPRYPSGMKSENIQGEVELEFVVDERGKVDLSSIQVMRMSARPFLQATLDALPRSEFHPMTIGGCPVREMVRMPFSFKLTR